MLSRTRYRAALVIVARRLPHTYSRTSLLLLRHSKNGGDTSIHWLIYINLNNLITNEDEASNIKMQPRKLQPAARAPSFNPILMPSLLPSPFLHQHKRTHHRRTQRPRTSPRQVIRSTSSSGNCRRSRRAGGSSGQIRNLHFGAESPGELDGS
jgi:hypothetical protein